MQLAVISEGRSRISQANLHCSRQRKYDQRMRRRHAPRDFCRIALVFDTQAHCLAAFVEAPVAAG